MKLYDAQRNGGIGSLASSLALYREAVSEALLETIWPTRCVLCDIPGDLLCRACKKALPYIDYWNSCRKCGAPHGRIQCSECNPISTKDLGKDGFSFSACISSVEFDGATGSLVSAYKDQGERRLGILLAAMMADIVPPEWLANTSISYIPATKTAVRRRGFDHAELLASAFAEILGINCLSVFERPKRKDQRILSRKGRLDNLAEGFRLRQDAIVPESLLLIDDVFTTGATMAAASRALADVGVHQIRCVTFARVW